MANEGLLNPKFEGVFSPRGAGEVVIADGWEPWFDKAKVRPEFKEEKRTVGRGRVHAGESGQKLFTLNALHDAGVWQRVNVEAGAWYEFSCWLYVWCSEEDNPDTAVRPGNYHAMVGANGWGHWPAHYATVWGKEIGLDKYNQWVQATVLFQAWHGEVSLIVRGFNEYKTKHNDLYIDDASFRQVAVYIDELPPEKPPVEPPEGPVEVDYTRIAGETADVLMARLRELNAELLMAGLLAMRDG